MIISQSTEIKINPANFKHFKEFKNDLKCGAIINVEIDNLSKGSSALIKVKCDICGDEKELKYKYYYKYGYRNGDYLCKKCKNKKNLNEKYGVDNVFQLKDVKEKIIKHNLEKYGTENVSQSIEIQKKKKSTIDRRSKEDNEKINNKRIETNIKKYDVENISQTDSIKEKKKEKWNNKPINEKNKIIDKRVKTTLKKYNKEYTLQLTEIKERIKKTNLEKYGVENPSSNLEIIEKIKNSLNKTLNKKTFLNINNLKNINRDSFEIFCNTCKSTFHINKFLYYKRQETKTTICTKCNEINKNISGKEIQLLIFIKDNYQGKIIKNNRKTINPYELDIYLPELNLAFEFNGIFWHNELYKEKNYHKIKTDLCREKDIQLIHIYEDDWNYRQDIIKSMILNKIAKTENKIFARKIVIKEVHDINMVMDFLNENHVQGYAKSSIKIGLFYDNELVSLMTFKKNNGYELNRFCNKINANVVGGASKLFKYFTKNYNYETITTFSNNDYSDGNLYKQLNFKKEKKLLPDYSYVIKDKRYHKFNFRKNKLIKLGFDITNKTEHEVFKYIIVVL